MDVRFQCCFEKTYFEAVWNTTTLVSLPRQSFFAQLENESFLLTNANGYIEIQSECVAVAQVLWNRKKVLLCTKDGFVWLPEHCEAHRDWWRQHLRKQINGMPPPSIEWDLRRHSMAGAQCGCSSCSGAGCGGGRRWWQRRGSRQATSQAARTHRLGRREENQGPCKTDALVQTKFKTTINLGLVRMDLWQCLDLIRTKTWIEGQHTLRHEVQEEAQFENLLHLLPEGAGSRFCLGRSSIVFGLRFCRWPRPCVRCSRDRCRWGCGRRDWGGWREPAPNQA